jgi:hypothetical protein
MTKPSNVESIEKGTGRLWQEWAAFLEGIKARDLTHREIADKVYEKLGDSVENAGWWAQNITVAYEQHIGRRAPGQRSDGTFEPAVSRTFEGSTKEAMDAWLKYASGKPGFNGVKLADKVSMSHSANRHHWGSNLADGTRVNVDTDNYGKSEGKSGLTITHIRITSAEEAEKWKSYWRDTIKAL